MRSDAVDSNSLLLKYVVNELTQAASWVHDKLEASAAAYVGVHIHVVVMEHDGCSATQWIDEHRTNSSAVDVEAVTEELFFEHIKMNE